MARKLGVGSALLGEGELDRHLTNVATAQSFLPTMWLFDSSSRLATTGMSQKLGGRAVPLWGKGELVPHLTQCGLGQGLPPYQPPSCIFIHPAVWPQ